VYIPPTQNPEIQNFVSESFVDAGKNQDIYIGKPHNFYDSPINFLLEIINAKNIKYVTLLEKDLVDQVHFNVSPPENETTRDLKVKLTLSVTNEEVGTLVQTYLHTIKVKERVLENLKTFEGVNPNLKIKDITVTMGRIDEFGYFNLTFSDAINLPDELLTWNDVNQDFINI
jgi:hypothetical protein